MTEQSDSPVLGSITHGASRAVALGKFFVFGGLLYFGPFIGLFALKPFIIDVLSEPAFGAILWGWALIGAILTNRYGQKF